MRVSQAGKFRWALVALALSTPVAFAAPTTVTTFPAGTLPEDIVRVPAGFGSLGGSYFVNNATVNFAGAGQVYNIPAGGGPAAVFANTSQLQPIGGVFLPASYGSLAGQYLAAGNTLGANGTSNVAALSSTGTLTPIAQGIGSSIFAGVTVAPPGFDTAGGQVLLANESGAIYTMNPSLSFSLLPGGTIAGTSLGNFALAPSGFGAVGGDLLIDDLISGKIYALSPSGALSLFTTVPLGLGQVGLRQMTFAPAGFGPYGGDLLVSVSGSNAGGGIAGSVDVLNDLGDTIAYLAEGTVGAPYDPRGLLFPDSTDLWVADADPSVFSVTSSDFTPGSPVGPVPEPASLLLLASGLVGFGAFRHRRLRVS